MEKKPEGTPVTEAGKERQPTLQEILADDRKSALFGEMLKAQGDGDMAKRLVSNEPMDKKISEEDLKVLTGEKLKGFLDRIKSVEACSSTMTPEAMNRILGGKSEKFEMIVKAVGVEGARNSIVPQLEMLAMKDPVRFKRMAGSFQFLEGKDTEIKKGKEINEAIAKFRDEHKFTEEEYSDIEKESTPEGRTKFFEGKFKEKFEEIEKIGKRFKWFGLGGESGKEPSDKNQRIKIEETNKLNEYIKEQVSKVHSRVDIENLKSQLEPRLKTIGGVLGAAILEDEDMNKAFRCILRGEETPEEETLGFKDAAEVKMPEQEALTEEYLKWAEEEEKEKRPFDEDTFSKFYVGKKTGNKKGFWSEITQKFIKGILDF